MQQLLIQNALVGGQATDILICNGHYARIAPRQNVPGAETFDAQGMALVPSFLNAHTHAGMMPMRGLGADLPLQQWLTECIWPFETYLTPDDIYWGTRLAIVEMLKSGTTFFNDMYWHEERVAEACAEMGIRACLGDCLIGHLSAKEQDRVVDKIRAFARPGALPRGLMPAVAPHAIYTCDEAMLRRCARLADDLGLPLHIHANETLTEVNDCLAQHRMRPVEWLRQMGCVSERMLAVHAVHLSDDEIRILSDAGATLVHNPLSNMKLASGVFPARRVAEAGCHVAIGTDSASSNNNLDMREEVKIASLLAKVSTMQSDFWPAPQLMASANEAAARAFDLKLGRIAEGYEADGLLLDLRHHRMVPDTDVMGNFLYAGDSECIDSTLCQGRLIMVHRHIPGEEEIIEQVHRRTHDILIRMAAKHSPRL